MEISQLREEINEIDDAFIHLFEKRMDLVGEIGAYKKERNMPIKNEEREDEIISRLEAKARPEYREFVGRLYRTIFDMACDFEEK